MNPSVSFSGKIKNIFLQNLLTYGASIWLWSFLFARVPLAAIQDLCGLESRPLLLFNLLSIGFAFLSFSQVGFSPLKSLRLPVVFTGVLSKNHNYKVFRDAIEVLSPKKNGLRIKLILAGKIDMDLKNIFSKNIEIDYKGYVNHEEAIRLIKSSHLLINFMYENTEETDMLSGKLTEYIASGSPIINFSNSSKESEYVLNFSKKSFNANSSSVKKVVKFINDEYNDWIAGKYQKSPTDNIDSLSRESLTKNLLDIINKINS